jgi:nitrous oxide reductase accessory protein NosL
MKSSLLVIVFGIALAACSTTNNSQLEPANFENNKLSDFHHMVKDANAPATKALTEQNSQQ